MQRFVILVEGCPGDCRRVVLDSVQAGFGIKAVMGLLPTLRHGLYKLPAVYNFYLHAEYINVVVSLLS